MFIVFDGIDGGGKSTQLRLLADWFAQRQMEVQLCKDPGSTELGEQIRSLLLGQHETPIHIRAEMLLFTAARTQLVEQVIRPALHEGKVVLLDRYILSTVVYQGYAGDLEPDDLWTVNRIATGNLIPDLTVIFDLPVDLAISRLGQSLDRMESRGHAYFEKVRSGFLSEASRWKTAVEVVDADRDPDRIHQDVVSIVSSYEHRNQEMAT